MNPKEYYYSQFRGDFNNFIAKSMAHRHGDEGVYIPIQDLKKANLSSFNFENRELFLFSLAFTVLIDQTIYAYFKNQYLKFQKLTQYPKFEYGITNMNVNPWDIAMIHGGLGKIFKDFCDFIIQDYQDFFEENKELGIKWDDVKTAMVNDHTVGSTQFGEYFVKQLKIS